MYHVHKNTQEVGVCMACYVSTAKQSSGVTENNRVDTFNITDIYPPSPMQYAPLPYNTGTNSESQLYSHFYSKFGGGLTFQNVDKQWLLGRMPIET